MRLGKTVFGGILILAAMSVSASAWADNSLQVVKNRGELIVGMCAQYPPFESRNEKTGKLEGFDIDIGKALTKEMGVKARFLDAEWQGLLGGLKKGDYDILITCMSKSEARGKSVTFSDVYYRLADVIVVRKNETAIKAKADLNGRVVGVQVGSGSEQIADRMKDLFKDIKRYNYNPEAFTDLKFKRIDAVLVGYAYAVNQIKTDSSYKVVGEPLAQAEIVMVMPQGSDRLTAEVNTALAKIRANGAYRQIQDRWLKVD